MDIEAYIGMQAGDEGKGIFVARRVLVLAEKAQSMGKRILNYRYQGGSNAGHTVGLDGKKYALHQMPSGIVFAGWQLPVSTLIGTDCYVNPKKLAEEIRMLESAGILANPENFMISSDAVMTLDYHVWESAPSYGDGIQNWSSTGTGNQPTATDRAMRKPCIRFAEFINPDSFLKILRENIKESRIKNILEDGKSKYSGYEDFAESYIESMNILAPFIALESDVFCDRKFMYGIAEGAQGADLDQSIGMLPGITGSNPSRPTHRPEIIRGVFKAYESSVGTRDRPFISRMEKELEDICREGWHEFGTTTKRPREVGWFDAVKGRYRLEGTHADDILLTCLDRIELLGKIGRDVEIVTGYEVDGKTYLKWNPRFSDRHELRRIFPVTESMKSWTKTLEDDGKTLTPEAERYVRFIEERLGKRFSSIGVGPDVKDVVSRR